ncbi:outer membrane beta-barrel protein [Rhizobium halophytocola]|uniref:Outer membrane beta-barrel protein n=1 Tax=Rhizobium halophytocola TaxID=735519 RepID=A0ABS4DTA3_9HYPH|nr:outer membrane beta-barrel protein [Rhizobium halophytocola]MBP1848926.1 hypothetical protein [Rhizobium halophytocola]
MASKQRSDRRTGKICRRVHIAALAAALGIAGHGAALAQTAAQSSAQSPYGTTDTGNSTEPTYGQDTGTAAAPEGTDGTDLANAVPTSDDLLQAGDENADFKPNAAVERENLRQTGPDDLRLRDAEADPSGVHLGTMILRPTLSQGIQVERTRTGASKDTSVYSETQLKGVLTSDWSRHLLTVTGNGTLEKVLSGRSDEGSSANLGAELRLDLADQTTVTFNAGYDFSREDPNNDEAVDNARTQYGIHRLDAGVAVEHDVGRLRGTVGLSGSRWIYTDAELNDGTRLSLSDRDRNYGALRLRLGYEVSPALTPFVEASLGRLQYDQKRDSSGYQRSADVYAAKAGVSLDLRDKLRGELALGYTQERFDDGRLDDISAMTIDSSLGWSPHEGTDVAIGLSTSLDPTSTAGASGSVVYATNVSITQQVRDDLVATLSGETKWTRYPGLSDSNSTTYGAKAELAYGLNRYFALTGGLGYEYTQRRSSDDTETLRATIGVSAKR